LRLGEWWRELEGFVAAVARGGVFEKC
jgi:hypothetical protein